MSARSPRRLWSRLASIAVVVAVFFAARAWMDRGLPLYGYTVVARYPHDRFAYTQGLTVHEGKLYESTGSYGRSSLRLVDLETGEVVRQADLSSAFFGEGIAILGDRIYQLTWHRGVARVSSLDRFELVRTFEYEGEGWGLTTDGERLYMSDGSHELRILDPKTFEELGRIPVLQGDRVVERLNELEWVEGEIWANVWKADWIVRIDPASGQVVGWIDLRGIFDASGITDDDAVLNGIAYDATAKRIFVTGKMWPYLFEIEVERQGSLEEL